MLEIKCDNIVTTHGLNWTSVSPIVCTYNYFLGKIQILNGVNRYAVKFSLNIAI